MESFYIFQTQNEKIFKYFHFEQTPDQRKTLLRSRSFGKPVETWQELSEAIASHATRAAEKLRNERVKVSLNMEGSSFKSQIKNADKSGAKVALIIGDQEAENKIIQVKLIRDDGIQESVSEKNLSPYVKDKINFKK